MVGVDPSASHTELGGRWALFDAIPDAVLVVDHGGRIVFANLQVTELLGYAPEELRGQSLQVLIPPRFRGGHDARREGYQRDPKLTRISERSMLPALHRDGHEIPTDIGLSPMVDGGQRFVIACIRDMTRKQELYAALRAREEEVSELQEVAGRAEDEVALLASAVNTSSDGIVVADRELRLRYWNDSAARLYGLESTDEGRYLSALVPPDQREAVAARWARVLAGESVEAYETVRTKLNGEPFWISLSMGPVEDAAGSVVGIAGISRDLTEHRELRSQLAVAERMASIGTLASGVAHEINNPLAYVKANIEWITKEVSRLIGPAELAPELGEALADTAQGIERVRRIVLDLKTFARPDTDNGDAVAAVDEVLDSTINMARNEIRHRARLVQGYPRLPAVQGNATKLGQVFLNLVMNAAEAIPDGSANVNEIRVDGWLEPGGASVVVEVRDTGTGIRDSVLPRIFEPFYTTKPQGLGMGLGLSICHGIVVDLGGKLEVRSTLGRGTTFRVTLPVASPDAWPARESAKRPVLSARRGRVLSVDDEPSIGKTLRRVLSREHEVVTETSAAAALARIDAGEDFDVIFCDLMMPVMSGAEFHRALQERAPAMVERVVFLTGGAFTESAREFMDETEAPYIVKPFDVRDLREAIAAALEPAGPLTRQG